MPQDQSTSPYPRRRFIRMAASGPGILIAGVTSAADEGAEVSPVEDLMREHGLLTRALLIYQEALRRLETPGADLDPGVVQGAARFLRNFIEDYHEKLEERHVFPLFEQTNLASLVQLLHRQHDAGRLVTDHILELANLAALRDPAARMRLDALLREYVRAFGPHAAREDTVLFPQLRKQVGEGGYDALGERFEAEEKRRFGAEGFERMRDDLAGLEKNFGIYDLAEFTPR